MFFQTLQDWELVVVDDGSTDITPQVLLDLGVGERPRTRLLTLGAGRGLAHALNLGIAASAAPLIARLDADDWMRLHRLWRQREFLGRHPEVGLLGSATLEHWPDGTIRTVWPPCRDRELRALLPRRNPFAHASVMFRRTVFESAGRYDETLAVAQDYDLFWRMARVAHVGNLAEPLTERRLHAGQVSVLRTAERRWAEARIRWRAYQAGWTGLGALPWVVRPLAGWLVAR